MEKLRFAVAGLGRIGKIHLDNLLHMDNVKVVAVTDPQQKSMQYAKDLGIPTVATYEDLLGYPEVDAIIICTPTDTHADYVEKAAIAGKHVFCEKPLDLNLKRVVEVLEIVEKTKINLMIGFNRRFDPEFTKVKDAVKSGQVGEPHLVKITSRDPGAPPVSYIEQSGGLFLDMTIHDFDMARFVVGKEVNEVYAKGAVLVDEAIGKAGDIDTAIVTLTYVDGTMAVIDNSREAAYGYDQRVEVFGSEGMVQGNNNLLNNHRLYNKDGIHGALPLHFFLERYAQAYKTEMQSFVDTLTGDCDIPVGGEDGLLSLKIGLAAKKSLQENRPVKLEEIK
ncbi:inositol 2-dehydrogenase [Flagellimonas algicola]|uniref:Inositol 2-dehydrogenase n=1 Tax=Flagellimonas algicola TaxID=2583815 RepID=A0ABY2WQT0_9FLAO|nr:inositol 2-dehydrogenase [Allomuricauda algicola]TMU57363.1 inositol 2-dehydrogenase [Allomuricauda algicola]